MRAYTAAGKSLPAQKIAPSTSTASTPAAAQTTSSAVTSAPATAPASAPVKDDQAERKAALEKKKAELAAAKEAAVKEAAANEVAAKEAAAKEAAAREAAKKKLEEEREAKKKTDEDTKRKEKEEEDARKKAVEAKKAELQKKEAEKKAPAKKPEPVPEPVPEPDPLPVELDDEPEVEDTPGPDDHLLPETEEDKARKAERKRLAQICRAAEKYGKDPKKAVERAARQKTVLAIKKANAERKEARMTEEEKVAEEVRTKEMEESSLRAKEDKELNDSNMPAWRKKQTEDALKAKQTGRMNAIKKKQTDMEMKFKLDDKKIFMDAEKEVGKGEELSSKEEYEDAMDFYQIALEMLPEGAEYEDKRVMWQTLFEDCQSVCHWLRRTTPNIHSFCRESAFKSTIL